MMRLVLFFIVFSASILVTQAQMSLTFDVEKPRPADIYFGASGDYGIIMLKYSTNAISRMISRSTRKELSTYSLKGSFNYFSGVGSDNEAVYLYYHQGSVTNGSLPKWKAIRHSKDGSEPTEMTINFPNLPERVNDLLFFQHEREYYFLFSEASSKSILLYKVMGTNAAFIQKFHLPDSFADLTKGSFTYADSTNQSFLSAYNNKVLLQGANLYIVYRANKSILGGDQHNFLRLNVETGAVATKPIITFNDAENVNNFLFNDKLFVLSVNTDLLEVQIFQLPELSQLATAKLDESNTVLKNTTYRTTSGDELELKWNDKNRIQKLLKQIRKSDPFITVVSDGQSNYRLTIGNKQYQSSPGMYTGGGGVGGAGMYSGGGTSFTGELEYFCGCLSEKFEPIKCFYSGPSKYLNMIDGKRRAEFKVSHSIFHEGYFYLSYINIKEKKIYIERY